MNDVIKMACDHEKARAIYCIFLGRRLDTNPTFIGLNTELVIKSVLTSEEFAHLMQAFLQENFFVAVPVDDDSIQNAKAFLKALGAPQPRTDSQPDLLLSALQFVRNNFIDLPAMGSIIELIRTIDAEYEGPRHSREVLDEFIQPDIEWICAYNSSLQHLRDFSEEEKSIYIARAVIGGEVEMSPFFCLGGAERGALRAEIFAGLMTVSGVTLEALLPRVRSAGWTGRIGHWMFDADYYEAQRNRAFASRRVPLWHPYPNPYIDFLINGDQHAIRPHPLFCPATYQALNSIPGPIERPFHHFVTEGYRDNPIITVLFDASYYQAMSPSVSMDIASGRFRSPMESFWREGCALDRPFLPDFDPHHYQTNNADIAANEMTGEGHNPASHFLMKGAWEGRSINPYFDTAYYLRRYPHAQVKCAELSIAPIEHFLMFGKEQGRRASPPLIDRHVDMFQAKALYERRAEAAFLRQARKSLDFRSVSAGAPLLSVIVPVHNQATFTARFLELAYVACAEFQRRTGQAAEIIIVSNGSRDATDTLLKRTQGIKTIIHADALGYPVAANEGAAVANGRVLLFVNNDIEFESGVFADILESYDATPHCGAVGPCILSMNLTIQEIGAFVANDGETFAFGRGDLLSVHANATKMKVDYVSGCFFCLERKDFEVLEGFDADFSPGYYEEVDLCQRMRKLLGKEVFVDPSVVISHYENASFLKGRPPTVSYAVILANRRRFLTKHPEISLRPTIEILRSTRGRSKIGFYHSRVLVIEDMIPDARLGSGFGRTAEILRELRELNVACDVMALNATDELDDYEYPDIKVFRHWMPDESLQNVLDNSAGRYSHIWVCRSHNLISSYEILKAYKTRYDAVIVCDTEAVGIQRSVALAKLNDRHYSEAELVELVSAELRGRNIVDLFIAVNERDRELIGSVGVVNISVISHSVSGLAASARPWQDRDQLLMVGAVHAAGSPNFDGLDWYMRCVDPRIRPFAKNLVIIGYWDPQAREDFLARHAHVAEALTGAISKSALADRYERALIAIAPTRYAAGVPCKVIEAMLTGTPVVMTELLSDQIGFTPEERKTLAIARIDDGGLAFASAIEQLAIDPVWWTKVRETQLEVARSRFSVDALRAQIAIVLERVGLVPTASDAYDTFSAITLGSDRN